VSGTNPIERWTNYVGDNGEQLVLSPDGSNLAYVTGTGLQTYGYLNLSANQKILIPKGYLPTGAYPNALAYSPDSRFAYALHWPDPKVDVYDTASNARVAQFTAIDRGSDMMADHTGQHLFVSYAGISPSTGYTSLVAYATGYSVPEPSAAALIGLALVSLCGRYRFA
jgi:DNA-binding beta-propeller fold protein YncE